MTQQDERPRNRRELCRDALRYLALGGIAIVSGGLIARSGVGTASSRCAATGAAGEATREQLLVCRSCASLANCRLPAADTARDREAR